MTKADIFLSSYRIYIFVFLTPLLILPCLEILFFINHYFLIYLFKYRIILRKILLIFLFLFWVRNLVALFIFTQLSVISETSLKQEHQQQQQYMVGEFDTLIVSLR